MFKILVQISLSNPNISIVLKSLFQGKKMQHSDYQVSFSTYEFVPQRFIRTPPSSSIYETSNGFAAIRPEPRHGKEVRGDGYERAHQNVDAEVDEFIKYEQKKVMVDYDRAGEHAAYGGNSKVSGEDVNSEADGFIRQAHERFHRKSRSVNYG